MMEGGRLATFLCSQNSNKNSLFCTKTLIFTEINNKQINKEDNKKKEKKSLFILGKIIKDPTLFDDIIILVFFIYFFTYIFVFYLYILYIISIFSIHLYNLNITKTKKTF